LKEEELDIISKGGNYGWPEKEGDSIFGATKTAINTKSIPPVYGYSRDVGICIIGGHFYQGSAITELIDLYEFE
jgi:glucose/arabinose dehydrogenase